MELSTAYTAKLTALIGEDEFKKYEAQLKLPCVHGLRANRLKISADELKRLLDGNIRIGDTVPWCDDGYYFDIDPDKMPGRMAYYLAGLYYIQEPSAMYPAANALIKPGERVLDLCAAPGGKSLRAASDLGGCGFLVSNDISASRAGTLLYNLELGGVPNAMVTNCSPAELAERFGEFFDVVLVDAPCSGEGMFRKDPDALQSWEKYKSDKCIEMQRDILKSAAGLVRPGGRIMYSTCTFDRGEDEEMVNEFLQLSPDFTLAELPKAGGVADGIDLLSDIESGVSGSGVNRFKYCARLWPHKLKGEGQFAALMVRSGVDGVTSSNNDLVSAPSALNSKCQSYRLLKQYPEELKSFASQNLTCSPLAGASFYVMGQNLYACTFAPVNIDRLKVLRMGLLIGEINYGKLKPSQHFIMSLSNDAFIRKLELDPFGEDVKRYLRGETLYVPDAPDGFTAVCVNGYQLGGGEVKNGALKNLYPKGWRRVI